MDGTELLLGTDPLDDDTDDDGVLDGIDADPLGPNNTIVLPIPMHAQ